MSMKVSVSVAWLKQIHRDLDACQKVIWRAGVKPRGYGFDPSYVTDAQARLKEIENLLETANVSEEATHG
jgi:predicted outer membrane protein